MMNRGYISNEGHRSQPPFQRSQPPVQRSQQPVQRSQPSVHRSQPPVHRSQPPAQRSQPPVQRSQLSVQRSQPPVQRSQPPIQRSQSPVQRSPLAFSYPSESSGWNVATTNWASHKKFPHTGKNFLTSQQPNTNGNKGQESLRCDLCEMSFNSRSMAKAHFEGKKHKAKTKKLETDGTTDIHCDVCDISLDTKEQAEIHYQGKKHKQNLRHKEKHEIKCELCDLVFSSECQAKAHYEGKKHKFAVESLLTDAEVKDDVNKRCESKIQKPKGDPMTSCEICKITFPESCTEEHYKGKKHLFRLKNPDYETFCNVCKVNFTSTEEMEQHYKEGSHRDNLLKKSEVEQSVDAEELSDVSKKEIEEDYPEMYVCEVCDIIIWNSSNEYEMHLTGKKHQNKLAKAEHGYQGINHCTVCNITLPSPTVAAEHFMGKKHKNMIIRQEQYSVDKDLEKIVDVVDVGEKKLQLVCSNMSELQSLMSNKEVSKTEALTADLTHHSGIWFSIYHVRCSLCFINLASVESASEHFDNDKHKKRESLQLAGDLSKWCPLCICEIMNSAPAAALHYNGKQHRRKLELAKELKNGDSKLLEEMEPCNAIRAANLALLAAEEKRANQSNGDGEPVVKKGLKESFNCPEGYPVNKDSEKIVDIGKKKQQFACSNMFELQSLMPTNYDTRVEASNADLSHHSDTWFSINTVRCRLCFTPFVSVDHAREHFDTAKHKNKESLELAGDNAKWCPICMVELSSPPVASMHYNGKQHGKKLWQAKKLENRDSKLLEEMEPANALRAAKLALSVVGKKRAHQSNGDEEPVLKKGIKESFFNCLFCNLAIKANEMHHHRASITHLENVQKAANAQVTKKNKNVQVIDPTNPLGL